MKMNTLNLAHIHTVSENALFSKSLSDNEFNVHATSMAKKTIENDALRCFSSNYYELGGHGLPHEVINMVIRNITAPCVISLKKDFHTSIFMNIAKQINDMNIHKSKDVWCLSCIFTQEEYGFKISFLKWFLAKHF